MKSLNFNFKNSKDEVLSAKLDLPADGFTSGFAVFAHCFTCGKNLKPIVNISRALTNAGLGVLRFDFTGIGESEGDFGDTNFASNVDDLVSASDFLAKNYEPPILIIGHSLGGTAAILASAKIDSVKAIAIIGAPASPEHLKHLLKDELDTIRNSGEAVVSLAGREFKIKKQFLESLEQANMQSALKNLRKPLIILHSPQDEIVGIENAAEIYSAAFHPKSFISLSGADHLLSDSADSIYAGDVIATWAKRYIKLETANLASPEKQVTVLTGTEKYLTEIKTGMHSLIADEPESSGGKNRGPSPYDFLTSALGACTSMTLRMYADRKGMDLQEIQVHLEHGKIHASDCGDCETRDGKIDRIERVIELSGNLSEDEKTRLMEIADKCPVHRTLHNEVKVVTTLKH